MPPRAHRRSGSRARVGLGAAVALALVLGLLGLAPPASAAYAATTMGSNFPCPIGDATAVWIGAAAYIFGGFEDCGTVAISDKIYRYDPGAGLALMTSRLPNGGLYDVAAFTDGRYAYIPGGSTNSGTVDTILRYDPGSDTLVEMTTHLPHPAADFSTVWAQGKAYMTGSVVAGEGLDRDIYRFDPASGVLDKMGATLPADLPETGGIWDGHFIDFFGANRGAGDAGLILRFDPATDTVSVSTQVIPPGPNLARDDVVAYWDGTTAWLFGGKGGSAANDILAYDPFNDLLTVPPQHLPFGSLGMMAGAGPCTQATFYLFGGGDIVAAGGGGLHREIVRWFGGTADPDATSCADANLCPSIEGLEEVYAEPNRTLRVPLTIHDRDGGQFTVKVGQISPSTANPALFDAAQLLISWVPTQNDLGIFRLNIDLGEEGHPGCAAHAELVVHVASGVNDADMDGTADLQDNCPYVANRDQADWDGNHVGDACDTTEPPGGPSGPRTRTGTAARDTDADGVPDSRDGCPLVADAAQTDADGDGGGDACDPDADGDGVSQVLVEAGFPDNCPFRYNPDQRDRDGDGVGDACDPATAERSSGALALAPPGPVRNATHLGPLVAAGAFVALLGIVLVAARRQAR